VFYNGGLHSYANQPTLFAVWTQTALPTAAQCRDWISTHPAAELDNVPPGTRVCIKTAQARYVFLRADSKTNDGQLQATVTVWGP
jgi:hypothetical protein